MEALQEAINDISRLEDIIKKINGTQYSGSWEWREILHSKDSSYQVLEAWDRDGKETPMEPHCHNDLVETVFVLIGSIYVNTKDRNGLEDVYIIGEGEFINFPSKVIHSTCPTKGTKALIICRPAEPAYVIS